SQSSMALPSGSQVPTRQASSAAAGAAAVARTRSAARRRNAGIRATSWIGGRPPDRRNPRRGGATGAAVGSALHEFDAAVACAPFLGGVVGHLPRRAVAGGLQPARVDTARGERRRHAARASFGQAPVVLRIAGVVGVAVDRDRKSVV